MLYFAQLLHHVFAFVGLVVVGIPLLGCLYSLPLLMARSIIEMLRLKRLRKRLWLGIVAGLLRGDESMHLMPHTFRRTKHYKRDVFTWSRRTRSANLQSNSVHN